MAGADGDGQAVHAGAADELLHLRGVGKHGVLRRDIHRVLDAGQLAQLAFHHNAPGVGIVHHLLRHGDIFFKAVFAAIDHNRGKAAVDAGLAHLKVFAVVQMQRDGQLRIQNGCLHQLGEINMLCIFPGAGRDLQDHRRALQLRGFRDALNDLHIVYIEGADGVAALIGLLKHFFRCDQWHGSFPLSK